MPTNCFMQQLHMHSNTLILYNVPGEDPGGGGGGGGGAVLLEQFSEPPSSVLVLILEASTLKGWAPK